LHNTTRLSVQKQTSIANPVNPLKIPVVTLAQTASARLGQLIGSGEHRDLRAMVPMAWRTWDLYAAVLVLSGSGFFIASEGRELPLVAGDLILTCPGTRWRYRIDDHVPWSECWATWDGPLFDCWRTVGLINPTRPVLRIGSPARWQRRFQALGALGGFNAILALQGLLADVLAVTSIADPWLSSASAALEAIPLSAGSVWQPAARRLALSPERFRKRFASAAGCGPAEWLDRRRIAAARQRLASAEVPLRVIADELGFCDVHHFARRFRELAGLPPGQWRAMFRRDGNAESVLSR